MPCRTNMVDVRIYRLEFVEFCVLTHPHMYPRSFAPLDVTMTEVCPVPLCALYLLALPVEQFRTVRG